MIEKKYVYNKESAFTIGNAPKVYEFVTMPDFRKEI